MDEEKTIYVVLQCDYHKNKSTMRACIATTSLRTMLEFMYKKIKAGAFFYDHDELPVDEQIRRFLTDVAGKKSWSEINEKLICCQIENFADGEEM